MSDDQRRDKQSAASARKGYAKRRSHDTPGPGKDPGRGAGRSLDLDSANGVGAGNGVKAGKGLRLTHLSGSSRESRSNTPGGKQDTPDVETTNRRAVCGKTARTVRREGRAKTLPGPYPEKHMRVWPPADGNEALVFGVSP